MGSIRENASRLRLAGEAPPPVLQERGLLSPSPRGRFMVCCQGQVCLGSGFWFCVLMYAGHFPPALETQRTKKDLGNSLPLVHSGKIRTQPPYP